MKRERFRGTGQWYGLDKYEQDFVEKGLHQFWEKKGFSDQKQRWCALWQSKCKKTIQYSSSEEFCGNFEKETHGRAVDTVKQYEDEFSMRVKRYGDELRMIEAWEIKK